MPDDRAIAERLRAIDRRVAIDPIGAAYGRSPVGRLPDYGLFPGGRLWAYTYQRWHNESAGLVTYDSGGSVMAYPCDDEDGNNHDTTTQIKIWIPYMPGLCPHVGSAWHIPYFVQPPDASHEDARYIIATGAVYQAPVGTLRLANRLYSGAEYGSNTGWQLANGVNDPQGNATPNYAEKFLKIATIGLEEPDLGDEGGSTEHTHNDHEISSHSESFSPDVPVTGGAPRYLSMGDHGDLEHNAANHEPGWKAPGLEIRVDSSKT